MSETDRWRQVARQELEKRLAAERGRYYTPNGGIERALQMVADGVPVDDPRIHIVIIRAGNGVGKTALACNIAGYLTNQYPNAWLDRVPCLKNFRRPNRGRILTTATAAQTVYDEELAKWLPQGAYTASKNGHKFKQTYKMMRSGSEFDILTFDQDPSQAESTTLDWAIMDEPGSAAHFRALKSRFRFGGIIFMVLTPLEGSSWYRHQFETPERIGRDVHVIELSSEENCKEHGRRGILAHATLASQWEDFDEDLLLARRDGKYLASGGLIWPKYRDENWTDSEGRIVGHVMKELAGYHRQCYEEGFFTLYNIVDPHDRKPFAFSWKAVFPNQDVVTIAEWPDETMRSFWKIKSCSWDPPRYAKMVQQTEMLIAGRPSDYRISDPNFGNAMKATSKSTIIQEFHSEGRKLGWPLDYYGGVDDDLDEGHLAVRTLIGDPSLGIRPKMFHLAHCRNHRFGSSNYSYKENRDVSKGLSDRPELQFKDFPDLDRLGAMFGYRYVPRIDKNSETFIAAQALRKSAHRPTRLPGGYVGMA